MDIILLNSNKDIDIINSYAPHMGYGNISIGKYWSDIDKHIDNIAATYFRWRLCGNYGQIGQK